MTNFSAEEKRLIYYLSGEAGDSETPYADLAERLGLTENEVLDMVRRFHDQGLIRRFGATLWHQRSGFKANAMVVFRIDPAEAENIGRQAAERSFVSHCYLRRTAPDWPYNLYTMIHAESRERMLEMAEELAAICRTDQWRLLESLREFKKASLRYFADYA